MKYYESSEDVTPPLKLEPCISAQGDQVYLAEPLVWPQLCALQNMCQECLKLYSLILEGKNKTRISLDGAVTKVGLEVIGQFCLHNNTIAVNIMGAFV